MPYSQSAWTGIYIVCLALVSSSSFSTISTKFDSYFYYEIGGSDPLTIPPAPITTTISVSLQAHISGLSCGQFDPAVSISNSLNALKDGADEMVNQLENAATAAISALPGYILMKASPGLYNLFQNGLFRAQQRFSLSTKSCESMMNQLERGQDPFAEWMSVSAGEDWRYAMGTAGITDLNQVKEGIDRNRGNSGLRWLGGNKRGGLHQDPVNVLSDIAQAGYNVSLARPVTEQSTIAVEDDSPSLVKKWNNPQAIADWVQDVLGDIMVSTCQEDTCQKGAIPGKGLLPKIHARTVLMKQHLSNLVVGEPAGLAPTASNLALVSAPGMGITVRLLNDVKTLEITERDIVVNVLATEIAESQVIDEALIIRRLLLTGKKEGHVQAVAIAQTQVDSAIDELEREVEHLIYEKSVRQTFVSDLAKKVLQRVRAMEDQSRGIRPQRRRDPYPYQDGYVSPTGEES